MNWEIFGELGSTSLWPDVPVQSGSGDPLLEKELSKCMSGLRGALEDGLDRLLAAIDTSYLQAQVFAAGHDHTHHLLAHSDMTLETYTDLLYNMYLSRFLRTFGVVFWCSSCHDDPFMFTTTASLSPEQLRISCPKCSSLLRFSAAYSIDPIVRAMIGSKDGVLGCAIGWLLQENGIEFEAGLHVDGQECDFVVRLTDGPALIEAKMFKPSVDNGSAVEKLKKLSKQARRHTAALCRSGVGVTRSIAVTNLPITPDELARLSHVLGNALAEPPVLLVDLSGLPLALGLPGA